MADPVPTEGIGRPIWGTLRLAGFAFDQFKDARLDRNERCNDAHELDLER